MGCEPYYRFGVIAPGINSGGIWALDAELDRELALRLRGSDLRKDEVADLISRYNDVVSMFFGSGCSIPDRPYEFVEGSRLLQTINLPNEAYGCNFSLKKEYREAVRRGNFERELATLNRLRAVDIEPLPFIYFPNKADSLDRAACLSILFEDWADRVKDAA
jgi:hypothetical protein